MKYVLSLSIELRHILVPLPDYFNDPKAKTLGRF